MLCVISKMRTKRYTTLTDFGLSSLVKGILPFIGLFCHSNGGLFNNRMGNAIIGLDPASGEPALQEPGLKMLHVPDVDYLTNYLTFKAALNTVKKRQTRLSQLPRRRELTVVVYFCGAISR